MLGFFCTWELVGIEIATWTGRWVEDGMGREAGALASSWQAEYETRSNISDLQILTPFQYKLFEKALGWWGSLVFFIFLQTTSKLCIEASKDRTWEGGGSLGWIWSRCLAWFHFSLPAVRVQLLLLVSQHLRVSYWSPGMMRCLGFDDDQDGYGPQKDCLDSELLWTWPW